MPPELLERGAPAAPISPAVEPSTPFAARVAAWIFTGEAAILLALAVLPNPGGSWTAARLAPPAACAAVAVLLHLFAGRVGPRGLQGAAALGTVLVSSYAWAWGSGSALSGELLYAWLALYAAYFFDARQAAAQLAWMAATYLVVLLASAPSDAVAGSWVALVGVVFPAAALLRAVRDGVGQLVRRLAEAALTDTLTGLKNRLAFDQELYAEVERALRSGEPLSVVVGDLDHFKSVNDCLGHRAGDEALVRIGRILQRQRRSGDSIGRTGGEEFTILLPGASEHEAYLVAERLRAAVQDDFRNDPVQLTFSFGVATYPEHGRTADAVLESADQALYAAKALGRNRCVIFNHEIAAIFAPEGGRGMDESQLATLLSLAEALDLRDTGTADHSRTVGRYCALIAEELGLAPERVKRVEVAGILHDIGKIGVPDAVLQKPDRLGRTELAQIRTHPEIGAQILSGRGLEDLREWVLAHHERPDGKGYPNALRDGDIPLEAKILAVGDAYEAMTAERVYRASIGVKAARAELLRCAGSQFDPRVVAAFLSALARGDREQEADLAATG
jgi:diguanylate cyclase (GGDEF)-like protein/putative nucleotidyltransferase with HDIG domain